MSSDHFEPFVSWLEQQRQAESERRIRDLEVVYVWDEENNQWIEENPLTIEEN